MNRRYRKTIIAGNWKMHKNGNETRAFFEAFRPMISKSKWCEIVLCVPSVNIAIAIKACKGTRIAIGAQNMHHELSGAYTGEVSAQMLHCLGVKYVILGHSERRQYFAETDALINKKVHTAFAVGIRPIICGGETLDEREAGIEKDHIRTQVKLALLGVQPADVKKAVIAYEPIWAIGTGQTATAEEAGDMCDIIRACLRELYGARIARAVTIQYGGSMNPSNAEALLMQPSVDGGLVGGASLGPEDFNAIIQAANQESGD